MNKEQILSSVKEKFGFVPKILEIIAESPATAQVYLQGQAVMAEAGLTAGQQQAVSLAVSAFNGCTYCRAAHRTASRGMGVAAEDIGAIDAGGLPETDPDLKHLIQATRLILEKRGRLSGQDLGELADMGLDRPRLYEIVALIGLKTITNYINHMEHTAIDPQFRG